MFLEIMVVEEIFEAEISAGGDYGDGRDVGGEE